METENYITESTKHFLKLHAVFNMWMPCHIHIIILINAKVYEYVFPIVNSSPINGWVDIDEIWKVYSLR